jgi:hypothetical protein
MSACSLDKFSFAISSASTFSEFLFSLEAMVVDVESVTAGMVRRGGGLWAKNLSYRLLKKSALLGLAAIRGAVPVWDLSRGTLDVLEGGIIVTLPFLDRGFMRREKACFLGGFLIYTMVCDFQFSVTKLSECPSPPSDYIWLGHRSH